MDIREHVSKMTYVKYNIRKYRTSCEYHSSFILRELAMGRSIYCKLYSRSNLGYKYKIGGMNIFN